MNKKFSTLMASLMLASAFSVSAQAAINNAPKPADKYVNGKYYMLGTGANVLAVESKADAENYAYGELKMVDLNQPGNANEDWTLAQTREALWQVTVTNAEAGEAPRYSFVNVATGMTLSVSIPDENGDKIGESSAKLMISGGYMEWVNGGDNAYDKEPVKVVDALYSYVNNTDVIFLTYDPDKDAEGIVAVRDKYSEMTTVYPDLVRIQPYEAETVALTAADLNKELITNNDDEESFTLSFEDDVTEGAENLFTGVELVATQLYQNSVSGSDEDLRPYDKDKKYTVKSDYVRLNVKDTKNYLVVDTALHTGSEALTQLPKFTYADPSVEGLPAQLGGNNLSRHDKAFNFKFAYEPLNDRVLIKVQEYPTMITDDKGNPVLTRVEGEDGNYAYTYWPTKDYEMRSSSGEWTKDEYNSKYKPSETNFVDDAYVRLVTLSSVRELTVAAGIPDGEDTANSGKEWSDPDDLKNGMLTTVKIGDGLMVYQPTTIDSGLYLIQFVKNSTNPTAAPGNYYVANLGGAFGYAEQARNQVYDHMPAAQWYVVRDGQNSASEFTLINREFFDKYGNDVNGDGEINDGEVKFGDAIAYRAFATDTPGEVFFRSGAFMNDTVKFIPVSDASKKDPKLGYKYVDEETSTVETYVFNYLHGLAASSEVGLNTPIAKDSLVRVDETGETIAFRLVPVIVDDSYGYQFDEKKTGIKNLIRNAYYIKAYDEIKFAEDNRDRYLTYDTKSKKYVMSTTPTAYYLKENNDVDGTHYYALVEAEYFQVPTANLVDALKKGEFGYIYPEAFKGMEENAKEEPFKTYQANYKDFTVPFYDKNGKFIATDASKDVPLYAYYANEDGIIELQIVTTEASGKSVYYFMNYSGKKEQGDPTRFAFKDEKNNQVEYTTTAYADNRVSVDDNTLDLTIASIEDKWNDEIRVSAFAVEENDAPLYRRFNGAAPETFGDASNAPLNLKFYRYNNDQEYLFENYSSKNSYRDGITDKEISFLGVNNAMQFAENETRSYTMFVDTAYVRNNTRMPQYLIGVRPEVVPGDTIWCNATSAHHHETLADSLACDHTIITPGFVRAMYLFNAQDSIDAKNYDYQGKAAYGAKDYTRLAFKDAVHAMDTLYILNPGVTTEQLIEANFKNDDLFAKKIFLGDNKHKNVVFQFRLLDEKDNRFLIESEAEKNGAAVLNKDLDHVCVAPTAGGWVKVQNGVPVIARYQDFNEASAQADVFDVNDEIKYDAVDNEEIAVEGVSVVAGNGQVTIMGAAGKNVTITNILGKVIANQTIASDNATIAVPAGIVAVAVEGEAAVKAIVK